MTPRSLIIAVISAIFLFIATQVSTEPRSLTSEEEAAANGARSHIAKVLEKNLIKFFTLVAADNGHELFTRQEDDDDEPGLNPQVLPQVAQILGAIFAGNLNLTSIVDRTFSLGPETIRNQVEGLFNLLTGNKPTTTTTTPKPKRKVKPSSTSAPTEETTAETAKTSEEISTEPATTPATTTTTKPKYKIRSKNRTTTLPPPEDIDFFSGENDSLYRLEEEVISAAIEAEPSVRDKQPRFFLQPVRDILANFDSGRLNLTQVIRFLPDLFQGARHAFVLLENLGKIAGVDLDDD